MCKIFLVAGIKPDKIAQVEKLAKYMAKEMSFMDEDGVGYAAITKDAQIYGEKWLNKDEAFLVRGNTPVDPVFERIEKTFGDTVDLDKKPPTRGGYSEFGERNGLNIKNTVALILHARKATQGGKTLPNVHPFVKAGGEGEPVATALIHNGSILNHSKLTKEMSECDSEVILHEYLAGQMYHNPWGIEQLAKTLVGTYAVGVLSSQLIDDKWVPYLDIFKSNKELIGGYVPQLDTFVFATTIYSLTNALKSCDMTLEKEFKVKDGYLHRLNAITGEAIEKPISFVRSAENHSDYNRQHENSVARSIYPYGPKLNETKVEDAKKHFERRHPSLFTAAYLEAQVTKEEKEFFEILDKDQKTDRKALRLVSAALGMGA